MNTAAAKPKAKPGRSGSLRGKPGSIGWLLAHELRLFWRRGKMNPKSGLILVGLCAGPVVPRQLFRFHARRASYAAAAIR